MRDVLKGGGGLPKAAGATWGSIGEGQGVLGSLKLPTYTPWKPLTSAFHNTRDPDPFKGIGEEALATNPMIAESVVGTTPTSDCDMERITPLYDSYRGFSLGTVPQPLGHPALGAKEKEHS